MVVVIYYGEHVKRENNLFFEIVVSYYDRNKNNVNICDRRTKDLKIFFVTKLLKEPL